MNLSAKLINADNFKLSDKFDCIAVNHITSRQCKWLTDNISDSQTILYMFNKDVFITINKKSQLPLQMLL